MSLRRCQDARALGFCGVCVCLCVRAHTRAVSMCMQANGQQGGERGQCGMRMEGVSAGLKRFTHFFGKQFNREGGRGSREGTVHLPVAALPEARNPELHPGLPECGTQCLVPPGCHARRMSRAAGEAELPGLQPGRLHKVDYTTSHSLPHLEMICSALWKGKLKVEGSWQGTHAQPSGHLLPEPLTSLPTCHAVPPAAPGRAVRKLWAWEDYGQLRSHREARPWQASSAESRGLLSGHRMLFRLSPGAPPRKATVGSSTQVLETFPGIKFTG